MVRAEWFAATSGADWSLATRATPNSCARPRKSNLVHEMQMLYDSESENGHTLLSPALSLLHTHKECLVAWNRPLCR